MCSKPMALAFARKFVLLALLVGQLIGSKTAVVEFLAGCNQVEEDASQFVSCVMALRAPSLALIHR
jgi:hypothetical protein